MKFLDLTENSMEKGQNILKTLVGMSELMHIPMIVEGVERENQAAFLQSINCNYVQGYYCYRPMPIDSFEKLLDHSTVSPL